LVLFTLSSAVWSGESGEIGLRLKHEGLGWRIIRITPESAAARAGLRVGEVVIGINNLFLPSEEQVRRTVSGLKPGDTLTVRVLDRSGEANVYELEAEPSSD
jgi:S1-C subfamily serine protease